MVASHTLDREPPAGQRRPRRRLGWPRNDARARLRSSSTGSGTDAASTDRRDGSRPRRSGEWAGTAAPDWSAPRSGCSPATAWRRVRIGSSPGFTAPRHPPLPIEEDVLRPTSNDGERHEDSLQLDAVLERRKDRAAGELEPWATPRAGADGPACPPADPSPNTRKPRREAGLSAVGGGLSPPSSADSGGGIRTRDLRVMSPTSYLAAPPRVANTQASTGPLTIPGVGGAASRCAARTPPSRC
jgi:hypothetical protein